MENSNDWTEEVFKSVLNQKLPTLNPDLFSQIEQRIQQDKSKIIATKSWKLAVAAAIIIAVNLFALQQTDIVQVKGNELNYNLISTYNIYSNE